MFNQYSYKDIDYAKAIERNGFISNRVKSECEVLVRYYNSLGYPKKEIKNKIIEICNRSIKNFYYEMYYSIIESAINAGMKKEPTQVDYITIYKEELDYINSLDLKYPVKKLMYGILVLKKLSQQAFHSEKMGFNLVGGADNYTKLKVFSGLKNRSRSEIDFMFSDMLEAGLISIRDDNKKYLLFLDNIQDSKEECFRIEDFETAYLHFDAYNEKYKVNKCEACGDWFKIDSRFNPYQKYCKKCANKVKIEQTISARKSKKVEEAR